MDRINLGFPGGFPLSTDDYVIIEDNAAYANSAIINGLRADNSALRLYGVEFSMTDPGGANPFLNNTAGAIWYRDEVFSVDAASVSAPAGFTLVDALGYFEWDLDETTNTPVTYKNTVVNDAYKSRKAKIAETPITWTNVEAELPYLSEVITPPDVPYATTSSSGVVELASQLETEAGTSPNKVVTPEGLGGYNTFSIAPYTGNNPYTQVSVVSSRYKKVGKMITTTALFTLTVAPGSPDFQDFEIFASMPNVFSAFTYGQSGTFAYNTGWSFNSSSTSIPDYQIRSRALTTDVTAISNVARNWTAGDSVYVQVNTSFLLQ